LVKTADARVFFEKIKAFDAELSTSRRILELGRGQCWASCMVKRTFPQAHVTGTDISEAAIASVDKWEHIYRVKLDATAACRSYETPFDNDSFDLAFAFAAAHHFVRHKATFRELSRILAPGGVVLYLHEPACPSYIHPLAKWRVNAKRPEVPEDVLRLKELCGTARDAGLEADYRFAPSLANRRPKALMYYSVMRKLPFLSRVLPCTADFIFRKPG
jgi:SAM-dependent methyltransferase